MKICSKRVDHLYLFVFTFLKKIKFFLINLFIFN